MVCRILACRGHTASCFAWGSVLSQPVKLPLGLTLLEIKCKEGTRGKITECKSPAFSSEGEGEASGEWGEAHALPLQEDGGMDREEEEWRFELMIFLSFPFPVLFLFFFFSCLFFFFVFLFVFLSFSSFFSAGKEE